MGSDKAHQNPVAYEVRLSPGALKELKNLTPQVHLRIVVAINELARWPEVSNIKKLSGSGFYRKRVGNYRLIFEVYNNRLVIMVIQIVARKDAY